MACWLVVVVLVPRLSCGQDLNGELVVTVKDQQGGAIRGAEVTVSSPAMIGGPGRQVSNATGQARFVALPPGVYTIDVTFTGFLSWRADDQHIGAGGTIERSVTLGLAGVSQSIKVQQSSSRIEARSSGFESRFTQEYLRAIPSRRFSMFDPLRGAPGISPTSASNVTSAANVPTNTFSAFGSGANESMYLNDGTNATCPCSGFARSEVGVDFIQEIQVQTVGASAEYGNMQGAVINVITKQGSNRFTPEASYFGQAARLTAPSVALECTACSEPGAQTGYVRDAYADATVNLGGPMIRDRVWFFAGYQYVRDADSQPGTDPRWPRTAEQQKFFGKATWLLSPRMRLVQSFHGEFWRNPERPTFIKPIEATQNRHASVPTVTFGNVTYVASPSTFWDIRVGRFVYLEDDDLMTGDPSIPARINLDTSVASGNPASFGGFRISRTTAKATVSYYRSDWLGANHVWKAGVQYEDGAHNAITVIPTGVRFEDKSTGKFQSVARAPSNAGGRALTASAFVTDAVTWRDRITINAGVRFDRTTAISQDLHGVDGSGREIEDIVRGTGSLYAWNVVSPRLGLTAKLTSDGRTMFRASYGRFYQGVLTGELTTLHPGWTATTRRTFNPVDGDYTIIESVDDSSVNSTFDPRIRSPRTDEYSAGVDREIGRGLSATVAFVHKDGADFIGWSDIGGAYHGDSRDVIPSARAKELLTLGDKLTVPVFVLDAGSTRRFLLTNPPGYSFRYDGLVAVVERRRSHGWQALGSYTWSRTVGLQPSSGTSAAGAQVSNLSPAGTYGQDPNDLTNAYGRLPNDRPHMFRVSGALDLFRTGFVFAAHLQHVSGKPWAPSAQLSLPLMNRRTRVQLEPRGLRRLSSPTLLDLRLSRTLRVGRRVDVALTLDVLNALNELAEEDIASDDIRNQNFAKASILTDPRRGMFSVRLTFGRQ